MVRLPSRSVNTCFGLIVAVCSLTVTRVHTLPHVQTVPEPKVQTFQRTDEGDWRTIIHRPEGDTEYVYVPPTKIVPSVTTQMRIIDLDAARIAYKYVITNGASARQEVARIWIGPIPPVTITLWPNGWQYQSSPGNTLFRGPGSPPAGVPAGSSDSFEIEGQNLPGVITIRAMGNTASAVTVPSGLTQLQHDELVALSARTTVNILAIGPTIAAGMNEPELSFAVSFARLRNHYVPALHAATHPRASDIEKAMELPSRENIAFDDEDVRAMMLRVRQLAQAPVADAWHRNLSEALGLCIEALMRGTVPIK